jgi:hypothetical protein
LIPVLHLGLDRCLVPLATVALGTLLGELGCPFKGLGESPVERLPA